MTAVCGDRMWVSALLQGDNAAETVAPFASDCMEAEAPRSSAKYTRRAATMNTVGLCLSDPSCVRIGAADVDFSRRLSSGSRGVARIRGVSHSPRAGHISASAKYPRPTSIVMAVVVGSLLSFCFIVDLVLEVR